MIRTKAMSVLAFFVIGSVRPAYPIELQRATIDAWQEYLCGIDVRMQQHLEPNEPFLWIDESGDRALRVHRGEITVAPGVDRGTKYVPDGLIHDWIGAVFIPNASVEDLLSVLYDYASYSETYKPAVAHSKVLGNNGVDQQFSMVWQRHVLFVNAAIQGWYRSHNSQVDSRRGYNTVDATRIQEIQNYRRSDEHLLPPDSGSGFVWRIHSLTKYEQRDGGVYLEIEAIVLTRDVPSSLRPLVDPIVHRLSINSLVTTLHETRVAVRNRSRTVSAANVHGLKDGF